MRTALGLLVVVFVLLPDATTAQSPPQIKYWFADEPGLVYVDDEGEGELPFHIFAQFAGFACAVPLELQFEVRVEPVADLWAAASAKSPPKIKLLPPGPYSGSQGQSARGLFVAAWDADAAPLDARQEYVLRATPVPPDLSYCAPRPPLVAGHPDFWNVTVCREPQDGGLGAGCKPLRPMDLGTPERITGPGLAWVLLAACVLDLRRPG